MRFAKYLLLGAASASIAACSDDDGASPRGPTALVRVVNTSPDAGAVNVRFVDKLENLPTFINLTFRGSSGLYQQVEAGERDIRIFFNTLNADSAKIRLIDETITLEAGQFYTLVYTGTVAGNADQLIVVQETIPDDPAAGQIAVKVIHGAAGTGAVDVYVAPSADDPVANPDATFLDVVLGESTAYQALPTLSGSDLYRFSVTPSGVATASFSASPNEPGAAKSGTTSAQAGVRQGGSVLTALVVPGAVAGSRAATSTNQTPTVLMLLDNVPGT